MAEIENHSYFMILFKKEIKEFHWKMMNRKTEIKTSDSRMNLKDRKTFPSLSKIPRKLVQIYHISAFLNWS